MSMVKRRFSLPSCSTIARICLSCCSVGGVFAAMSTPGASAITRTLPSARNLFRASVPFGTSAGPNTSSISLWSVSRVPSFCAKFSIRPSGRMYPARSKRSVVPNCFTANFRRYSGFPPAALALVSYTFCCSCFTACRAFSTSACACRSLSFTSPMRLSSSAPRRLNSLRFSR